MGIIKVNPVILNSSHVRSLCTRAYKNHKYGCPNFHKKQMCPPFRKMFNEVYDLEKEVYAIYNIFPFVDHVRKMKSLHPEWSQRQAECCLYWQGKARKQLRIKIIDFVKSFDNKFNIIMTPEAMGVNLTATMNNVGRYLEWPPKISTFQIALAAFKK